MGSEICKKMEFTPTRIFLLGTGEKGRQNLLKNVTFNVGFTTSK